MRVLGVDWGERRIGLAVSDDTGTIASPYKTVANDAAVLASIVQAAAEAAAEEIIIGFPLTMTGEEGPQAEKVKEFAFALQSRVALPIKFVDERLTTKAALEKLRHAGAPPLKIKATADAAAAALILQTYLDTLKRKPFTAPDL